VQITISARHGHLSPGTQEKITEKVEVVRKFLDRMTAIQVTVDLEHRDSPTDEFVAIDQADTVLAAIDSVVDKMENQLRRYKEKLKEHRATGHKHLEPPASEPEA